MICRSSWSSAPTRWRTTSSTNWRGSPTFRFRPKIFAPGEAQCSAFAPGDKSRGAPLLYAGAHAGRVCPRPPTEKPTCALCGGAHVASYRGCEVWKRAIARQLGQTPVPHPKQPATRRPGGSFAAAASGAPSAVPTASVAPAPAASEAVPTPEAPAPPPQPLVAGPGAASPGTSAGLRPSNRRRGGHCPVGTQRSAPSVEQPQVDSHSAAAAPPPSSDRAAPAASTADLADLVAQLTALVTNATKLIEVLSQQLTAAVLMAAPAPTAVNPHQMHRGQRVRHLIMGGYSKTYNLHDPNHVAEIQKMLFEEDNDEVQEDFEDEVDTDCDDAVEVRQEDSETEENDSETDEDVLEENQHHYTGRDKETKWNKVPPSQRTAEALGDTTVVLMEHCDLIVDPAAVNVSDAVVDASDVDDTSSF
ncbi:sterile alpha motif domain-containing protein 1-like [Schistocerca americana]|uniref:sterile alpha motif domain-containing protein 1-like n=1 Tax=Schistocerca americana TaxID=7009 RepID=UPI001F503A43|nr:sterile alpha motif domain-containing protein 1-like [Schistocerca americana]